MIFARLRFFRRILICVSMCNCFSLHFIGVFCSLVNNFAWAIYTIGVYLSRTICLIVIYFLLGRKRLHKPPIGGRLERFILDKFGSIKNFAETENVSISAIDSLISGRRNVGAKWQLRLEPYKLNWHWLQTGEGEMYGTPPKLDEPIEYRIHFFAPKGVSEETRGRYQKLLKELEDIDPERIEEVDALLKIFTKKKK